MNKLQTKCDRICDIFTFLLVICLLFFRFSFRGTNTVATLELRPRCSTFVFVDMGEFRYHIFF